MTPEYRALAERGAVLAWEWVLADGEWPERLDLRTDTIVALREASAALPALLDDLAEKDLRIASLEDAFEQVDRSHTLRTSQRDALRAQLADIEALHQREYGSAGDEVHQQNPHCSCGAGIWPCPTAAAALSVPAVPGQPGADEDGFGGDAPKPYLGPSLVVPAVPVDEVFNSNPSEPTPSAYREQRRLDLAAPSPGPLNKEPTE